MEIATRQWRANGTKSLDRMLNCRQNRFLKKQPSSWTIIIDWDHLVYPFTRKVLHQRPWRLIYCQVTPLDWQKSKNRQVLGARQHLLPYITDREDRNLWTDFRWAYVWVQVGLEEQLQVFGQVSAVPEFADRVTEPSGRASKCWIRGTSPPTREYLRLSCSTWGLPRIEDRSSPLSLFSLRRDLERPALECGIHR